jgi:hypothetical protein
MTVFRNLWHKNPNIILMIMNINNDNRFLQFPLRRNVKINIKWILFVRLSLYLSALLLIKLMVQFRLNITGMISTISGWPFSGQTDSGQVIPLCRHYSVAGATKRKVYQIFIINKLIINFNKLYNYNERSFCSRKSFCVSAFLLKCRILLVRSCKVSLPLCVIFTFLRNENCLKRLSIILKFVVNNKTDITTIMLILILWLRLSSESSS